MQINPAFKLEKAASKDQSRPVLTAVYLDNSNPEAPVCVATDSYALAVVPVEVGPDDTSGLVPVEAVKAASKSKRWPGTITANGGIRVVADGVTFDMPRPDGQFPDWRRLVPEEPPVYRIALNAEILRNLAEALGGAKTTPMVLEFGANPLRPIRVTGADGAFGILMPIRTDNGGLTGPAAGAVEVTA